LLEKLN